MSATVRRNLIWISAAICVVGGIFYYSIRSVAPRAQSEPLHVGVEVETQVDVAPDGVATMRSLTHFSQPPILVAYLRELAQEQHDTLAAQFESSMVKELAEQPWQVGGVNVNFVSTDPKLFTADINVTLYHYSWVESASSELWYSPGIVTRQDGMLSLVSFLESMGRPVSDLTVHSTGIAYWPAGAHMTETLPRPGQYSVESSGLAMNYTLKLYTDGLRRPVVESHFDFGGPRAALDTQRLHDVFERLLAKANVDRGTRNVFVRYHYPLPSAALAGVAPKSYDEAPMRGVALGLLALVMTTGLVLWWRNARVRAQ